MADDNPHWVAEGFLDSAEHSGEDLVVSVDNELGASDADRPVVVEIVQRGRCPAAGRRHGEVVELGAPVCAADCVRPPLVVESGSAGIAPDTLLIFAGVNEHWVF
jgi:hypothetical protein